MFVNLTGVTFRECLFNYDSEKESFQELQFAIPQSMQEVKNFQKNTELKLQALDALFINRINRYQISFQGSQDMNFEGILWKRSHGFRKVWKYRYFVCKDHNLTYYKLDGKEGEKIPLLLTSVKTAEDSEHRFCFELSTQSKKYILSAPNDFERLKWISTIQNNIQYELDHSNLDIPSFEDQLSMDMTTDDTSTQISETCADCGAPNPAWCCINWGTKICINCSGVHRSLTTSISKVRSLTLDKLDPSIVSVCKAIGNQRANSILEENMTEDKIDENAPKELREMFIKQKYVSKYYISQEKKEKIKPNDIIKAIREGDITTVYKAVCYGLLTEEHLILASCVDKTENSTITALIALNLPKINFLDKGGWSPLSYTAYFGNMKTAKVLLAIGANAYLSHTAHPYSVAKSRGFEELAIIFLPYWKGLTSNQQWKTYHPPNSFTNQLSPESTPNLNTDELTFEQEIEEEEEKKQASESQ